MKLHGDFATIPSQEQKMLYPASVLAANLRTMSFTTEQTGKGDCTCKCVDNYAKLEEAKLIKRYHQNKLLFSNWSQRNGVIWK